MPRFSVHTAASSVIWFGETSTPICCLQGAEHLPEPFFDIRKSIVAPSIVLATHLISFERVQVDKKNLTFASLSHLSRGKLP